MRAAPSHFRMEESNQSQGRFPLWAFAVLILIILGVTLGSDTIQELRRRLIPPSTVVEAPELRATHTVITVDPETVAVEEVDYETAALAHVYAQGNPSVVNIQLVNPGSRLGIGPFGEGSGFVWDEEGHIVTNAHVVTAQGDIVITFADDTRSVAERVGIDLDSDLAVIKIAPEGYDLRPVTVGDPDALYVGARVAAIGSPFSRSQTLTSGIVSQLGRNISGLRQNFQIPDSIQFDAAINPGNSGGPLFNDKAEVVGVVSQVINTERSSSGIGMAVSVSIVKRVVPALIEDGFYRHSYLGIQGVTFSPICADQLNLPRDVRGVYVVETVNSSPAARSDLRGANARVQNPEFGQICPNVQGGDLIVGVEGQEVRSFESLMVYLVRYTSPGDRITLTVQRDSRYQDLDIVLGTRPNSSA